MRTLALLVVILTLMSLCACGSHAPAAPSEQLASVYAAVIDSKLQRTPLRAGPRLVLLNFWAPWCSSCVGELPSLQALRDALHPGGFEVIAVVVDTEPDDLRNSDAFHRLHLPVAFDRDGSIRRHFGVGALPKSIVFDPLRGPISFPSPDDGTLVTQYRGPARWDSAGLQRYLSEYLAEHGGESRS